MYAAYVEEDRTAEECRECCVENQISDANHAGSLARRPRSTLRATRLSIATRNSMVALTMDWPPVSTLALLASRNARNESLIPPALIVAVITGI